MPGVGKGADRPSPRATRIRGVRARLAQSMWFMAPPLRALRGGLAEPPVSPARQATGYALSPSARQASAHHGNQEALSERALSRECGRRLRFLRFETCFPRGRGAFPRVVFKVLS